MEKGVEGSLVWEVEVDSDSDYSGDYQEVFTPGEVLPGVMKSLDDIVSGDDVVGLGLLGERELSPPEEEGSVLGWASVDVPDADGGF